MDFLKNFTAAVLPHAVLGAAMSAKSRLRGRMILPAYVRQIRHDFPELHFEQARLIDSGLENIVVVLDDKWIFRFPRSEWRRLAFAHELQLLMLLRERTGIALPDYRYVTPGARFGGYPMLKGEPLDIETFQSISEDGRCKVIEQFVNFLNALHGLGPVLLQDGKPHRGASKQDFATIYFDQQRRLFDYRLDRSLVERIDRFFAAYAAPETHPERLVHGDIDDHHLLLDRQSERLGVIDFGDAAVGDPAMDFAFLFTLPEWAAPHAFSRYAFLAGDPELPKRALRHSVRFAVSRLWNCLRHEGHPRVLADTADVLKTQLALLGA